MTNEQLKRAQKLCKENSDLRRLISYLENRKTKDPSPGPVDEFFGEYLPPGMVQTFENAVGMELNKRLTANMIEFEAL